MTSGDIRQPAADIRILILTLTWVPSLFAAPSLPAPCVAAMRHALGASANWRMERTLPDSVWPLVSTGTVECAIGEGEGIRWRALHPFPSLVEMTKKGLSIEDEDGRSVREAAKMPRYAELCRAIDAFAAGDDNVFDGMFDVVDATETPDGGWSATLAPKVREMRRIVEEIAVYGADAPTNAVLRTSNGGVTAIRFEESADAQ